MDTENKKILSIIIPTYNAEKFLDKGLSSFLADDNSILNKIEVIVVNDGKPDNSVEVAQKYVDRYPNVFKILNKKNGGHGSAINAGVKAITGEYFKVVDADDWVNTEVLKETVTYLENLSVDNERAADVILMSYRSYVLQREGTDEYPYDDKFIKYSGGPYTAEYVNDHLYDFWWGLSLHGVIYNTQFYRNIGRSLIEGVFYEDQEFSIVPMAYARNIYAYDKPLYEYRVGDVNQSVSLESSLKRLDHYEKVIMRLVEAGNDEAHFSNGGKALWFSKTTKFINDYMQLCLIRNPDKGQLRKRIKALLKEIKQNNKDIYDCVYRNYKVFCVLNRIHMSDDTYHNKFVPFLHKIRK